MIPLAGDLIKTALTAIGITEERVTTWLGRPCGCRERQNKLNRLDAWLRETIFHLHTSDKELRRPRESPEERKRRLEELLNDRRA